MKKYVIRLCEQYFGTAKDKLFAATYPVYVFFTPLWRISPCIHWYHPWCLLVTWGRVFFTFRHVLLCSVYKFFQEWNSSTVVTFSLNQSSFSDSFKIIIENPSAWKSRTWLLSIAMARGYVLLNTTIIGYANITHLTGGYEVIGEQKFYTSVINGGQLRSNGHNIRLNLYISAG